MSKFIVENKENTGWDKSLGTISTIRFSRSARFYRIPSTTRLVFSLVFEQYQFDGYNNYRTDPGTNRIYFRKGIRTTGTSPIYIPFPVKRFEVRVFTIRAMLLGCFGAHGT